MNETLESFLIALCHIIVSTIFLVVMLGINLSWDIYWLIFIDEPDFISSLVIVLVTLTAIIYFVIIWFIVIGGVLIKLGIWKEITESIEEKNSEKDSSLKETLQFLIIIIFIIWICFNFQNISEILYAIFRGLEGAWR